jgi:protein subunit release factor A
VARWHTLTNLLLPPHRVLDLADHRTKINCDLNKVLEGGLEESIQAMIMLDQQELLKELMETT